MVVLNGASVGLRPADESDFATYLTWMNDPEIAWWMDYSHPYTLDEIAADIEVAQREGEAFTITFEGNRVGRIGLNSLRQGGRIASTYMFIGDASLRRRGLARDAMMTLLAYAFSIKKVRMVDLMVLAENDAAIALYRSCGFSEDGRLRERSWKDGRWMDQTWMSVTDDEFERVRGADEYLAAAAGGT